MTICVSYTDASCNETFVAFVAPGTSRGIILGVSAWTGPVFFSVARFFMLRKSWSSRDSCVMHLPCTFWRRDRARCSSIWRRHGLGYGHLAALVVDFFPSSAESVTNRGLRFGGIGLAMRVACAQTVVYSDARLPACFFLLPWSHEASRCIWSI